MKQTSLFFPLLLIIFGVLWFLKSMHWFPETSDIIAFFLIATGILVFVLDGFNKQSVVSAPLLMYFGGALYVNQHHDYPVSPMAALGLVLWGLCLLLARSGLVPPKHREWNGG